MIESRCGLQCESCSWRASTGCPGCLHQEHPFWGVCPLKTCCEGKGHAHCGECADFVCAQLHDFAYDTENGIGDGARIEQCRRWKGET